jgi:hypothetical protein
MSLWQRLSTARIASEVRFVLGGGVAGATAGTAVGLLAPEATIHLPAATPTLTWLLEGARGLGLGWWAGILWSVVLVFSARRSATPSPVAALATAAWVTAGTTVAGAALPHFVPIPFRWGVVGGLVVGTLTARACVGRGAATPRT